MRWRRIAPSVQELRATEYQLLEEDYIIPYDVSDPRQTDHRDDYNDDWLNARLERGAFGRTESQQNFMMRWLMFDDDDIDDAEWGPVRILGAGSYGRVGLWQKRDEAGQPVDELAMKENTYNPRTALPSEVGPLDANAGPSRLLKEAVIQRELNDKDDRAAPFLRRYKFLSEHRSHEQGRYRCYLEFCPHDNLLRLGGMYRAWDTYLPEVFLWHAFHRLAISCRALHDTPRPDSYAWNQSVDLLARRKGYCLHLDIKPANVLLDYASEDPRDHDFPGAKLSDCKYPPVRKTAVYLRYQSSWLTIFRWYVCVHFS